MATRKQGAKQAAPWHLPQAKLDEPFPHPVPVFRTFDSGATRDLDNNKPDYEGFLSPLVIEAFGRYMHKNRLQKDGTMRDGDNWQKDIPQNAYMKSNWKHFMAWWMFHRKLDVDEEIVDALCALLFNVQGYLHEYLKRQKASRC